MIQYMEDAFLNLQNWLKNKLLDNLYSNKLEVVVTNNCMQ